MNNFVRRRIAAQPRSVMLQVGLAAGMLAVAVAVRLALDPLLGPQFPYITFFPSLVVTAVVGGGRAGLMFLLLAPAAVALAIHPAAAAVNMAGAVVFMIAGGVILWLSQQLTRAVRDLEAAHGQEHMLVLELHHRVKNILAVVQALAAQTMRTTPDGDSFRTAFTERLAALGRAQNVLSEGDSHVPLEELVRRVLDPFFMDAGERLAVGGDPVELPAEVVSDLALCLHELGTNATKHGALRTNEGKVHVRWTRLKDRRVELTWVESGGPPVAPPKARGFGARLLERGLSRKANPDVSTRYLPEGLQWRLQFDLP